MGPHTSWPGRENVYPVRTWLSPSQESNTGMAPAQASLPAPYVVNSNDLEILLPPFNDWAGHGNFEGWGDVPA
jgi:hypothetical protein